VSRQSAETREASASPSGTAVPRIYVHAVGAVSIVWAVGTVVVVLVASLIWGFEREATEVVVGGRDGLALSLASGVVALMAAVPGLTIEHRERGRRPPSGRADNATQPGRVDNATPSGLEGESGERLADSERGKTTHPGSPPRQVDGQRLGLPARDGASSFGPSSYGASFLIGLLIRTAGTVALFFCGGYYMHATPEWIAAWVLLWHVILLAVEVFVLAKHLPNYCN